MNTSNIDILVNSSRPIIRSLSKKCKEDNRYILESVIAKYVNPRENLCIRCTTTTKLLSPFINPLVNSLKLDEKNLKEFFKDIYLRDAAACAIEGIGEFGFREKSPGIFLYLLIWNFTNLCNYKCRHCYQNASKEHHNELSLDEKLDLIDQFIDARGRSIIFSGGEPTLSPDFIEAVKYAHENGLKVSIASNGFMFAKEKFVREVKNYIDGVQISLDSPHKKLHDEFRGFRGSYSLARKAIKNLKKYKIDTAYCYFITKDSVKNIPQFEKLALKDGVRVTVLYDFKNCGRAKNIVKLDLNAAEREMLMDNVCLRQLKRPESKRNVYMVHPRYGIKAIEHGMPQLSHIAPLNLSECFSEINFVSNFLAGCGAGFNQLSIQPDGTIIPCTHMPISLGNIRKTTIKKVWHTHKLLKLLRNRERLKGVCGKCENKYMCGGCRTIAYNNSGDLMESDPSCILVSRDSKKLEGQA